MCSFYFSLSLHSICVAGLNIADSREEGKRERGGKPADKTNKKRKFADRVKFSPDTQQVEHVTGRQWGRLAGHFFFFCGKPGRSPCSLPRPRAGIWKTPVEERPETLQDKVRGGVTATSLLSMARETGTGWAPRRSGGGSQRHFWK